MKKTSRHDSARTRVPKRIRKKEGRWEFTQSGSLMFLGAVDAVRRAAYRTQTGELRFLPLGA